MPESESIKPWKKASTTGARFPSTYAVRIPPATVRPTIARRFLSPQTIFEISVEANSLSPKFRSSNRVLQPLEAVGSLPVSSYFNSANVAYSATYIPRHCRRTRWRKKQPQKAMKNRRRREERLAPRDLTPLPDLLKSAGTHPTQPRLSAGENDWEREATLPVADKRISGSLRCDAPTVNRSPSRVLSSASVRSVGDLPFPEGKEEEFDP